MPLNCSPKPGKRAPSWTWKNSSLSRWSMKSLAKIRQQMDGQNFGSPLFRRRVEEAQSIKEELGDGHQESCFCNALPHLWKCKKKTQLQLPQNQHQPNPALHGISIPFQQHANKSTAPIVDPSTASTASTARHPAPADPQPRARRPPARRSRWPPAAQRATPPKRDRHGGSLPSLKKAENRLQEFQLQTEKWKWTMAYYGVILCFFFCGIDEVWVLHRYEVDLGSCLWASKQPYYKLHQIPPTLLPNEMSAAKCRGDGGTRTLQEMWRCFQFHVLFSIFAPAHTWPNCKASESVLAVAHLSAHVKHGVFRTRSQHLPQSNLQFGSSTIQSHSMISNLRKFPRTNVSHRIAQGTGSISKSQLSGRNGRKLALWQQAPKGGKPSLAAWSDRWAGPTTPLLGPIVSGCLRLALGASKVSASCTCQQRKREKSHWKTHASRGHVTSYKII